MKFLGAHFEAVVFLAALTAFVGVMFYTASYVPMQSLGGGGP